MIYVIAVILSALMVFLACIGVLLVWDISARKLCSKRNRQSLDSMRYYVASAGHLTWFVILVNLVYSYLLTPAVGGCINFFFAG